MTVRPQTEPAGATSAPAARPARRALLPALAWALAGALMVALLSQIPARHPVDVGGYDAAYVQGFHDPEAAIDAPAPYLAGSDGAARWTRGSSALLFPQAGLPGEITLRLRGWRERGEPPEVTLLLNGAIELARLPASGDWQEISLPVRAGALKASDFFIEVRAPVAALADGREVGVLIDQATYRTAGWPLAPYPAQLAYGAAVGALLWALLAGRPGWAPQGVRLSPGVTVSVGLLGYGLLWTLLYRLQPPLYPYPLRGLPLALVAALAALLALRDGPALLARRPALLGALAPAAVGGLWLAQTLLAAQGHVTLSRPGVENDFRVFATRETLAQVLSADGFYNLGYPLLLWLARPLYDGNAFLAGRLLAALSGAALLGAGYWLARALLPPGPALVALLILALSGFVGQYGLYLGSDTPFAACAALCVAATVAGGRGHDTGRRRLALAALAGLLGGLAYLMRHPGLLLLPWGLLALWLGGRGRAGAGAFAAAFLLAAAPQLIVNTIGTGDPLYNQQAKNIWLAVYAGADWGRWEDAPNSVGLAEVVLRDPGRFLANWWGNLGAYVGSGAEDVSEFGRAIQLRLLGWPANWLAAAGLLGWGWLLLRRRDAAGAAPLSLLLLILLYVAAVSTAFALQRFFLPLAPIYAAAAGWALWRVSGGGRALAAAGLCLVVVLWGGSAAGGRYVLANQPADEVAAVQMVQTAAPGAAPIAARVSARLPLAKYSAIAHRVIDWPAGSDTARPVSAAEIAALREAGARYLLWDEAAGPPPLVNPAGARVGASPRYGLYDLGR
jgi:4-amino-4-deoxy-L-arabinose transferase-like glycosyltransferase